MWALLNFRQRPHLENGMVNLGFSTMATPELDAYEAIAAAQEYGYSFVCLRAHEMAGELQLDTAPAELANIRRAFADAGVGAGCLFGYNPMRTDAQQAYTDTLEYTLRLMELAAGIGAQAVRLFADERFPEAFAAAAARALEQTEVAIVLQNHAPHGDVAYGIRILEQIASPRAGMAFSPDHCSLDTVYAECETVRPYIKELFVTNKRTGPDGQTQYVHIEEGSYDWERICGSVKPEQSGIPVVLKWERIWHRELEEYRTVLPRAKKWFEERLK